MVTIAKKRFEKTAKLKKIVFSYENAKYEQCNR